MPQGILHLGKIAQVEHVNTKKVSKGSRLVKVNPIRLTTLTFTYIYLLLPLTYTQHARTHAYVHPMLSLQLFNKAFLKLLKKTSREESSV